MADAFSIGSILATIMSYFSSAGSLLKPLTEIVKPLLTSLGGIFLGGTISPYVGGLIVLVVAVLALKLILNVGKIIIIVVGIVILLFLLTMIA